MWSSLLIYFYYITGVAQGVVTGIRGLCNGLGPALFGFIFYLFHVDLNETTDIDHTVKPPGIGHKVNHTLLKQVGTSKSVSIAVNTYHQF